MIYSYDKVGNRLSEDNGSKKTTYEYNGLDQIKTATIAKGMAVDEVKEYTYDANGNQIEVESTKTKSSDVMTYDAQNQLSSVGTKDSDGTISLVEQNTYNGEGQRIQKVEGGKTTNYFYQDGVVSYTTAYYSYNKDIQGSTTSLIKEDGTADATYSYTDYGETSVHGDNIAENEVCYTGGIYDATTGQYYLNARYYTLTDGVCSVRSTIRYGIPLGETQRMEAS